MSNQSQVWKVRATDLRRMAASSAEPERARKMLVLADQFEEKGTLFEFRVRDRDERGPE